MQQVIAQSGLVVMIAALKDGGLTFLGSGFVCHPRGYVLTCAHLLDLTANLQITIPPPIDEFHPLTSKQVRHVPVKVVQIDADNDVALLRIDGEMSAVLAPNFFGRGELAHVGTIVGCLGIPFGDRGLHTIKLTSTVICGKSVTDAGSKRLHLDANMHQGNSGGPVVSALSGQVIGIVSERFSPVGSGGGVMIGNMPLGADSTISFAVPIEYGVALLDADGANA